MDRKPEASVSARDGSKVDVLKQHRAQALAGSKDLLSMQVEYARGHTGLRSFEGGSKSVLAGSYHYYQGITSRM